MTADSKSIEAEDLGEMFDQAFDAGQDEVLVRQFDNDPRMYRRYKARVIAKTTAQLNRLLEEAKKEAYQHGLRVGESNGDF